MVQKTIYKTKDYSKVKFSFSVENAESIEVLGLNGDWEIGVPMTQKKDGSFSCEVNLPKNAQYEFKYRVNGTEWYNDTEADGTVANSFGGSNCVINL
jgi:hypothetical protein